MNKKKGYEDYLRVIFEIDEFEFKGVKNSEIAQVLRISKSSVSEMIKKLSAQGWVKSAPYSKVFLTEKGKQTAKKISRKHEIIEKFAKKIGHSNAHEEAHELEHSLSNEMLIKITQLMNQGELKEEVQPPSYIR